MKRQKTILIILEVITFLLLIIFLAPIYIVLLNTTKDVSFITNSPLSFNSVSFMKFIDNIKKLFGIGQGADYVDRVKFLRAFLNSVIITSFSLMFIGIFSGMAAWVLVRTKTKYSNLIFLLFISGMVIPFQIVMLPLVRLLNNIQNSIGLPMKGTYWGVVLVYLGFGSPLSIFLFHGFIKSIPMDIEEAAIIDGCSKPQLFFKVILPILKPIFITLLILNGMWIWNDFLLPMLVIGASNESIRTLPLAVSSLAGQYVSQWDLMLTAVLFTALPVIVLFLFAQKHIIKGMTSGAIK